MNSSILVFLRTPRTSPGGHRLWIFLQHLFFPFRSSVPEPRLYLQRRELQLVCYVFPSGTGGVPLLLEALFESNELLVRKLDSLTAYVKKLPGRLPGEGTQQMLG